MFSSYRSLVLGLTSKHYHIASLKTMRCQFSLLAGKAGATTSPSVNALPDMKDEYGDMDCSGETFIAKNFELESGHVLSEAHVRYSFMCFLIESIIGPKTSKNFFLFCYHVLRLFSCQTILFIQEFSLYLHCPNFKN